MRRRIYLANTFSPAMLGQGLGATIQEVTLDEVRAELSLYPEWESAVSHEVTAGVLTALLGIPVPFARINLVLNPADRVICVVPNFRANEAREFTRSEVESAGYRCFLAVAV